MQILGFVAFVLYLLYNSSVTLAVGTFRKITDMGSVTDHGRCEPITVPLCKELQYNDTIMPNLLNHQKQEDAGLEVHQFFPLVKVQCSAYLKFFLCTVYVPICTVLEDAIPPCRSLCIQAKTGCEDLMNKFGFKWPENLDCNKFPVSGLCVGENKTDSDHAPGSKPSGGGRPGGGRKPDKTKENISPEDIYTSLAKVGVGFNFSFCPAAYSTPKSAGYKVQIGNETIYDCGIPCDIGNDTFGFDKTKRQIIRNWIGIWSGLCITSTVFTVLTFIVDTQRFKYPERPIIFMSACYCFVAIAYLVGFFINDSVACVDQKKLMDRDQEFIDDPDTGKPFLITQGTRVEGCTILFIMIYFSIMASAIWWVILAITWFLTAGLKWGHEAIDQNAQYFHLAAGAIPTIKIIAIFLLSYRDGGYVDGDSLSGVCFTGISDKNAILGFLIAPLVTYLVIGIGFLLAGFVSLFRIRTIMKHDGTRTDKLEKLMVRIGIFSVLYSLPATTMIACFCYEYFHHDDWMKSWYIRQTTFRVCSSLGALGKDVTCPVRSDSNLHEMPEVTYFLIKYLSFFVVGVVSGIWIWSKKTVRSWGNFCWRICNPFKTQNTGAAV